MAKDNEYNNKRNWPLDSFLEIIVIRFNVFTQNIRSFINFLGMNLLKIFFILSN